MLSKAHWIILFACLQASCGKADNEPKELTPDERITAKVALYTSLADQARDQDGAILTDKCDSWHFTALQGAVIGGVNPQAFIDPDGKLQRSTKSYEPCYPGRSGSESAKEMYVYGSLYALKQGDLNWAIGRFEYGASHQWVMGEGPISRTLLTLNGRATLAQTIDALGGKKYPDRLWIAPRPLGLNGYEAFAEAVGIVFEGARFGSISDASVKAADDLAIRNPRNMMYACIAARWGHGDQEAAKVLLLDPTITPNDRRPTSADHCEPWITQRDDDDTSAWMPCPEEGKTHPPGAFLLAAAVCQGTI